MQIIKSLNGLKQQFDTTAPELINDYTGKLVHLTPLHHTHGMSDLKYLRQYFPTDHPIFENFGRAFYYVELKK